MAAVKRAYYDLYFNEQAEAILRENRRLASDFVEIAKRRYATGSTVQQDVLRAEVAVADLDRELVRVRQGLATARADLAQQLHVSPEADLRTVPAVPIAGVPAEVDRLYRLAVAARPELRGRLAAIARDERAVELARKRYYPNVTLGLSYMDMEKTNAQAPRTAGGFPNVGLFVGFNLPVYREKLAAGVREAESRAVADAKLYDAERDGTYREVKDLMTQAKAQRDIIELFRASILPKSVQALEASTSDYQTGGVDYVTLITAWREVLQIELQVAQVEAELGKALASLERAVGVQLNEHPPAPSPAAVPPPPGAPARSARPTGRRLTASTSTTIRRGPAARGTGSRSPAPRASGASRPIATSACRAGPPRSRRARARAGPIATPCPCRPATARPCRRARRPRSASWPS